jgi:carbamoyltransferase
MIAGDEIVCSIQKERLTRRKHDWGRRGDVRSIYFERLPFLTTPVDLVVECYSADPQLNHFDEYRQEIADTVRFRGEPRVELISHHLAHAYSVYPTSGFDSAAVMIMDSVGSPVSAIVEEWPGKESASPGALEVASFYVGSGNSIECIHKQLWNYPQKGVGLGNFYYLLTRTMFVGAGSEGKVMGLASYGAPDDLELPPLVVREGDVFIPAEWLQLFGQRERFDHFLGGKGSFEDCARLAAAGQRAFENAVVEIARWLAQTTKATRLCFAGGTALNCVTNTLIRRDCGFEDVFIPPAPHDGGTALGCAMYGMLELLEERPRIRWSSDYLGPDRTPDDEFRAAVADNDNLVIEKHDDLPSVLAHRIARGEIVALFQGRSESGPRALGHRSIIADPRRKTMRDWINRTIKGREMFRPLAPMVLLDEVHRYFNLDHPSPHMLYTVETWPDQLDRIPAVVHVDGSARVQTIAEGDDPFVRRLLENFRELTGIGVLLNTSFNGKDDPIVETIEDALTCFLKFPMHILAFPPYLVVKKASPPIPE